MSRDTECGFTRVDLKNVQIRTMRREEMSWVYEFTKSWPFYDEKYFFLHYDLDPGCYICAELKDSKDLIGCACALIINDERAHGSMFMVKEEYRYQGVGKLIQQARFDRIGDRSFSVFGVKERQAANLRVGLKNSFYDVAFYRGKINHKVLKTWRAENEEILVSPFAISDGVELDTLVQYEKSVLSFSRENILRSLFSVDGSYTYIAKDVSSKITGFIHLHPVAKEFRIFPWYADNENVAMSLFLKICQHLGPDDVVQIDSPENSRFVARIVSEHNWETLLKGVFMSSDVVPPKINVDKILACSFAATL